LFLFVLFLCPDCSSLGCSSGVVVHGEITLVAPAKAIQQEELCLRLDTIISVRLDIRRYIYAAPCQPLALPSG